MYKHARGNEICDTLQLYLILNIKILELLFVKDQKIYITTSLVVSSVVLVSEYEQRYVEIAKVQTRLK